MEVMDAAQLGRWTRFAAKGGIGRATALVDYVAEQPQDLMFLKGDEIVVLLKLEEESGAEVYLGHCEGVIGRFDARHVRFHSRLKTPVRTRRSSLAKSTSSSASRPLSSTSTSRPVSRDEIRAVSVTSPVPLSTSFGGSPEHVPSTSGYTISSGASEHGNAHGPTPSLSFSSNSSTPYSPRTPIDPGRVFGHERGAYGYEKGILNLHQHQSRPSEASSYSHASSSSFSAPMHVPSPAASTRTFGHATAPSSVYSVKELDESRSVYSQDDGRSVYSQRSGVEGEGRVSLVRTASLSSGDRESLRGRDSIVGSGVGEEWRREEGGERTSLVRTASLSTQDRASLLRRSISSFEETTPVNGEHGFANGYRHEDSTVDVDDGSTAHGHADPSSSSSLHSPHSPPSHSPPSPTSPGQEREQGDGFAFLTHARDDSLSAWAAALGGSHRRADSVVEPESSRNSFDPSSSRRISFDSRVGGDERRRSWEGGGEWERRRDRDRESRVTLDSRADPRASMAVLNPRDSVVSFNPRDSTATFNPRDSTATFNPRDSTATVDQGAPGARAFNPHASMAVLNPRDSTGTLDDRAFDQETINPRESVASVYSDESGATVELSGAQAAISSLQRQLDPDADGSAHRSKPSLASSVSSSLVERLASPPTSASGPLPSPYSTASLPPSQSTSSTSPPPPSTSTHLAPPAEEHEHEHEDQGMTGIGLSLLQDFGADSSDEDSDAGSATMEGFPFPAPPTSVPARSPPGSAGFRSPMGSADFKGGFRGSVGSMVGGGFASRPGSVGAGMGGMGGMGVQSPPPMVRSPPPIASTPPQQPTSPPRAGPSTPPAHPSTSPRAHPTSPPAHQLSPPAHSASPPAHPISPPAHISQSPTISLRSKRSLISSSSSNEGEDDGDGDSYWDGAGDIYDDYRYSRASILSRASKKSTRSAHHHWGGEDIGGPPTFPEELRRPSLDSVRPGLSRLNTGESAFTVGSVYTQESTQEEGDGEIGEIGVDIEAASVKDDASVYSRTSLPATRPLTFNRRPAPLTVSNGHAHSGVEAEGATTPESYRTSTSPLLHTAFQHLSMNSDQPETSPLLHGSFGAHQHLSMNSAQSHEETSPLLHGGFGSPGGELSPLPNEPLPTPVTPNTHIKGVAVRRSLMAERQMSDSTVASSSSVTHEEGTMREITPLERVLNKSKEAQLDQPLIVVNPAPAPPPYVAEPELEEEGRGRGRDRPVSHEATFHDMPTPVVPPSPTTPHNRGSGVLPSVLTPGAGLPAVPLPPVLPPGSAPQLRPRTSSNAHDPQTRQSLFGSSRTSIFAPHPNAPKPASTPTGPMYGRTPLPQTLLPPSAAQSLINTMRAAAVGRVLANGQRRVGTIYGATEGELLGSTGPVIVRWSNEPPNDIPAMRMRRIASEAALPGPGPSTGQGIGMGEVAGVPGRSVSAMAHAPSSSMAAQVPGRSASALAHAPGASISAGSSSGPGAALAKDGVAIPRANFYPKAGTARPRSRSFSSFESPFPPRSSSKDASVPQDDSAVVANPAPSPSSHNPRVAAARRQYSHTPSPLALQQTTASAPSSPLLPPARPGSSQLPSSLPGSPRGLTMPKGSSPLTIDVSTPPPIPASRAPIVESPVEVADSPVLPRQSTDTVHTSPTRRRRESERTRRTSGDTDITHASEASGLTPNSPRRSSSLRSKLSFSALRAGSRDAPSENSHNTVQVQDTDFELVVPNVPALPPGRGSESDSPVLPRPSPSFDQSMLRADSPAMSMASSLPRSPISPKFNTGPQPSPPQSAQPQPRASMDNSNVEAHRQRETKWVGLLGATKPADARKNKKVRKLLQEGVPASVRYQVWAHLTDSKSKRLEGLYARLCARGRVGATPEIERDVRECFMGDKRLADPQALVNLLQAYLVMVPDIQYQRGLTYIAGQLLMQSPEEDAFWIFITLMDTHLRPYFAASSAQLEVDAALFARAVEAADPAVGKRLFTDYSIPPVDVVRPWFTSLFVEALPTEYFQRVWDIFLSEGVVFLFRAGMALLTCTRRTLLDTKGADACLALLRRPPSALLSDRSPDALVELALAAKLKDDDIRKQRVKMEAAVKLQTQHTRKPQGATAGSSPAISLPNRA